jgi:hypothetical protein
MLLVYLLLDAIVSGLILWIASKLTREELGLKEAVIVSGGAALVGFIPVIGRIASIIIFFYLLKQFTQARIWPDLILIVLVSKLLSWLAVIVLVSAYK